MTARISPEADAASSKLASAGPKRLMKYAGTPVEDRIAGVQRIREPVLGGDELGETVEPSFEGDARCVLGHQHWRRIGAGIDLALEDGFDEI